MNLLAASDGELNQAPQSPSPSPEGEGVQGLRQINQYEPQGKSQTLDLSVPWTLIPGQAPGNLPSTSPPFSPSPEGEGVGGEAD